jgi:hypothetical protein
MSTRRPRSQPAAHAEVESPAIETNTTVYRDACGSFQGLRLHHAGGEPPCSECLRGEALRLLELERMPQRLSRPCSIQEAMTTAQGAANRAALQHALDAIAEERKAAGWSSRLGTTSTM